VADPSIRELTDKVDDLSRLVARQSGALGQLAESGGRRGPDIPLLVDLHALRGDALAAAGAARSAKERSAFEAIATGLERLLAGRGGVLVMPRAGHPFSAATMEAAEEVACTDTSLDRTVAALLSPGLEAEGRTVRPARVAVHRYATQPATAQSDTEQPETPQAETAPPETPQAENEQARTAEPAAATPEPAPERNGHVNGTTGDRRATRTDKKDPARRSRPARRMQGPTAPAPEAGEPEQDRPTQPKQRRKARR
jgi:molecular chaperone GrpE